MTPPPNDRGGRSGDSDDLSGLFDDEPGSRRPGPTGDLGGLFGDEPPTPAIEPFPTSVPQDERPRLSDDERRAIKERRDLVDRLRAWRKDEAERRGVTTLAVLPNPGIEWLVDNRPGTLDELAAAPDLGPDRIARYGQALLAKLSPATSS